MRAVLQAISLTALVCGPAPLAASAAARSADALGPRLVRASRAVTLPNERRVATIDRAALSADSEHPLAGFSIELDTTTLRPQRAVGGEVPWLAGSGNDLPGPVPSGPERRQALFARAFAFVREHADLYRLEPPTLARDEEGTVSIEGEELDVVRLAIVDRELRVLGAGLTFVVRHGDLVYFGSSYAAPIDPERVWSGPPRIVAGAAGFDAALRATLEHAGLSVDEVVLAAPRRARFLLPEPTASALAHRRIRVVRFQPVGEPREWESWIDESSGEVVGLFAAGAEACAPSPATTRALVEGGVRPQRADDAELVRPLPHVDVGGGQFSDRNGAYDYAGEPRSSHLSGRYVEIDCLACQNPLQAAAGSSEDGGIRYGQNDPGDDDRLGNGTSTVASRTAYLHANVAHDLADKWLDGLGFLDSVLDLQVNQQNPCNAVWSGFAVKLSRSSMECRNTGEIRDVIAHEWGHALDDFDGNGITDRALSEGASDLLALFLDRSSCIAESVTKLGDGPSDTCSGFRDLDELARGLEHTPPTLTVGDNDCELGVHCLGEIYGQAAWHLVHNLATGQSYADGSPLGPALGEDRAYELSERFLLLSRPLVDVMDPDGAGLSLYDAYMLIDRSPAGEYPHAAYVNEAFGHHGLHESPPFAPGLACPEPPAPAVTTSVDLGPDGAIALNLAWDDVAVARRYRLLGRRDGGERAFLPIGPPIVDDGRPGYFATWSDLVNGASYDVMVLAEGDGGCFSPATGRQTVTVAVPELEVASHLELDPLPGGDGDGILEAGEFVEVHVELTETRGLVGAGAVEATLTSLDPLVRVTAAPPVSYGVVPPLGTAPGSHPFVLHIDPAHDCQGRVPLILSIEHDRGCHQRALHFDLPASACPTTERSDVRFVAASIVDDDLNPDCGDGDLNLDAGEQARLEVRFGNFGSGPASSVQVLLSTPNPDIIFASGSSIVSPAALDPGAEGSVQFELLAGELACWTSVPLDVELSAPENVFPDLAQVELIAERDFRPTILAWDFEAGVQGWQAEAPWALTTVRSNPDDSGTAFHAGAVVNSCAALESPAFRLHPTEPATLVLHSWYHLQGLFQGKFWDGVNVHLRLLSGVAQGQSVLLQPSQGRGYDWALNPFLLCEADAQAWCDDRDGRSWASSTFDLSAFRGETVALQFRYSTDNRDTQEGFYLDDVVVTNATNIGCDGNECLADPDCSAPEMTLQATTACSGQPVTLQASFDFFGQGAFEYLWDFGDGSTASTAVPDAPVAHAYRRPGSFKARLEARSVANPLCSTSATVTIAVAASPFVDAGADVDGPSAIGTPGFPGLDYLWGPATGLSDVATPQPFADPVRTTEYCIEVTDPVSGCASDDCVVVRVPSPCGAAAADIDDLKMARALGDVHGRWTDRPPADAYALYRLVDKRRITSAEAWNTKADLVDQQAAPQGVDPGAVPGPPANPELYLYQVVPVCP